MVETQRTEVMERPDLSGFCRTFAEPAPLPMALVEGASDILCYVNPAFCRLLDTTAEELVGKPFFEVVPDGGECVQVLTRVFQSGKPESYRQLEDSAGWSYTMWRVLAGDRTAGVMIQVTESARGQREIVAMNEALMLGSVRQHELTEAAEILNARLQEEIAARSKTARELAEKARLLDLTHDAIIVRGLDEKISLWNKGARNLFGWTSEEMIGKQLHSVLKTEFLKPREEIVAQLHREGQFSGEVVQIARDGRRVPCLCRWVLDADTESILTSYTDLSEYKAIENELRWVTEQFTHELEETVKVRTAELSETIGHLETFSYTIVHDLRAPLRAMQGFGKILAEECGPRVGPQGLDYIERIVNSAQRMDRLIQDVLNYSGMARGEMKLEPVDLHKLLQGIIETYPSLQPSRGEIRVEGRLPVLLANEGALTQTLSNLLENAFEFVAPGIVPKVHIWSEPSTLAGLPSAKIYVRDNGVGIAKEYQKTIFGIFQRLSQKADGTGIGLAIVAKAVERMGGKVGLQSEPGKGSTFWLELKRVPAKG